VIPVRSLGWLPDAEDVRDFSADRLFSSAAPPPRLLDTADLSRFRGPRTYQGPLSACVAFALKRAIRRCDAVAIMTGGGDPDTALIPSAAPRFLYYTARQQVYAEMPPPFPAPLDGGCYPRFAMEAVRKVGFCIEEACPYDLEDVDAQGLVRWVNMMPPLRAFRAAYDQTGFVYQRVYGVGRDRMNLVGAGLRAGYACIFGMPVDRPFCRFTGGGVIDGIDPAQVVGGHMLDVDGFEDGEEGEEQVVRFDNWWDGFGDADGKGRMSSALFGSSLIGDVYLIKSVPMFSGAA